LLPHGPFLVFAPHPDDETLGMGGTIALASAAGVDVFVVFATNGEKGGDASTRKKEGEKATKLLGIKKIYYLGLPDRDVFDSPFPDKAVIDIMSEIQPSSLFLPSFQEIHPDHRALTHRALSFFERHHYSFELWLYEINRHGEINRLIDTSSVLEIKEKAIDCYASQLEQIDYKTHALSMDYTRAITLGNNINYAEGFWCYQWKADYENLVETYRQHMDAYFPDMLHCGSSFIKKKPTGLKSNMFYSKLTPTRCFCLIIACFCLLYVFITPPFESPDEPAHFARAYGISEGQFILKDHPQELVHFMREQLSRHAEFSELIDNILKNEPGRIPNLAFNTALYSPVSYMGYAVVLKIFTLSASTPGRLLLSLYLCRLLSFCFLAGVLFYAANISSSLKWPLLWITSTPMVLAQAGSINIDVIVFGTSIIILLLSIGQMDSWKTIWALIVTGGLLMMAKPVYAPILIIPLVSLAVREIRFKAHKIIVFCLGSGLFLLPACFWNYIIKTRGILAHAIQVGAIGGYGKVNPSIQLSQIMSDPFHFMYVIFNTFKVCGNDLYHQFVGVFAWLDTPVPVWVTVLWAFSAIFSLLLADRSMVPRRYIIGAACIIGALFCLFILMLSGYLLWMGVGADVILLQGRYFHVMVAMLMLGISMWIKPQFLSSDVQHKIQCGLIISACVINCASIFTIVEKYWR